MSHKTQVQLTAKTTGIETEGPSAGELVCPTINVWAVDGAGTRRKRVGSIKHDEPVKVFERTTDPNGQVLYHVRAGRVRGWVTDRFLLFDDVT